MDNYEEIIERWVRDFRETMSEYEIGCNDGDTPNGVKIIFDGFGNLETDDEYVEHGDTDMESYAVFIHKTSLTEEFPEHTFTPFGLMHRPKEEVCIYAWYNRSADEVEVIPFEFGSTELDDDFVRELIFEIERRDSGE